MRVERGDFEAALAERVNTAQLVGDIGAHWLKLAEHRPTVCFAVGVTHSIAIRDEFRREKFYGEKPPWSWRSLPLVAPQPHVLVWVRSQARAYAQSRGEA